MKLIEFKKEGRPSQYLIGRTYLDKMYNIGILEILAGIQYKSDAELHFAPNWYKKIIKLLN